MSQCTAPFRFPMVDYARVHRSWLFGALREQRKFSALYISRFQYVSTFSGGAYIGSACEDDEITDRMFFTSRHTQSIYNGQDDDDPIEKSKHLCDGYNADMARFFH
jgi:hypothetical protein